MLRLMNVIAVVVLIGSAVYAYSIKYSDDLPGRETSTRLKHEMQAENDGLAMSRAEWAHVAAPVRVEALADQYLGGQVMQLSQIATLSSLPDKGPATDAIGNELKDLGVGAAKGPVAPGASASADGRDRPWPGAAARIEPEFDAGLRAGAGRGAGLRARSPRSPASRRAAAVNAEKGVASRSSALISRKARFRIRLTALAFGSLFLLFIGRKLAYLGTKPDPESRAARRREAVSAARPDNLDRNGELLATDVKVMSVFADPRRDHRQGRGGRSF